MRARHVGGTAGYHSAGAHSVGFGEGGGSFDGGGMGGAINGGGGAGLTLIEPSEIVLQHIIGEGSFGRVWAAQWRSSRVAVKEFVFAQAAVAAYDLHSQLHAPHQHGGGSGGGSGSSGDGSSGGRSGGGGERAVAAAAAARREAIDEIVGEAGIMAYLRHPRVLQLFGCSLTAQAIWIVSELCTAGSLRQVLDDKAHRPLPTGVRLQMAVDVAEGMAHLHSRDPPIIHRDLKSHNLFVTQESLAQPAIRDSGGLMARASAPSRSGSSGDGGGGGLGGESNWHAACPAPSPPTSSSTSPSSSSRQPPPQRTTYHVKIGDWGSARAVARTGARDPKTMTHGIGTVCWLAPEVIRHGKGSERIDVYSFGIVLWELATRDEVYAGLSAAQVIARVANEGLRPPVPRACPWASLMEACWHEDPAARPTFGQVLSALEALQRSAAERKRASGRARHEANPLASSSSSSSSSSPSLATMLLPLQSLQQQPQQQQQQHPVDSWESPTSTGHERRALPSGLTRAADKTRSHPPSLLPPPSANLHRSIAGSQARGEGSSLLAPEVGPSPETGLGYGALG